MNTDNTIHSDLAIPPGEYLEEVIEELGLTKDELARRMGRPPTKLSPIFKGKKIVKKPTFTVFHNGVLVQDHVELQGGTDWRGPHAISDFVPHEDRLPIKLQDHGNPVRYRNIWVRELAD